MTLTFMNPQTVKTGAIQKHLQQCEDYLEAEWLKVSGKKYEAIREKCAPKGLSIACLSSKEDIPLF